MESEKSEFRKFNTFKTAIKITLVILFGWGIVSISGIIYLNYSENIQNKELQIELQNIAINFESKGNCLDEKYQYEIINKSKFSVILLEFMIYGQIPGRSTLYPLDENADDHIIKPNSTIKICKKIDKRNWPEGESLIISLELKKVIFQNFKNETFTVYK